MDKPLEVNKFAAWMEALRLRTLPLAFSCIFAGTAIALLDGHWNPLVLGLSLLTTLFLQVLSNLANDYGDSQKGVDNEQRLGPQRTVQSGKITATSMKKAMWIVGGMALLSGVSLIYFAFGPDNLTMALSFLLIGLLAILAAVKYTVGSSPYGYKGLGDFFVFLFFGLIGVLGVYYLHSNSMSAIALLPAISIGCWSTAVLNLNNMRDHDNDKACGKRTLVVIMGLKRAKVYHFGLIVLGWITASALIIITPVPWIALFVIPFVLQMNHLRRVYGITASRDFDPELKKLALSTFLFATLLLLSMLFV